MSEPSLPAPITAPPTALSESASKVLADPLAYGETFNAFLEAFVFARLPTKASLDAQIADIVATIAQPVGSSLFLTGVDLTANTSEYVYTHPATSLTYLYANGATVSATTYADLFAWFGGHIWAADPGGGNFVLPDARGRSLLYSGTHADVDVGDVFGPATESSRRGNTHGHAVTNATVTGAPTAGTLAVSPNPHSHSYDAVNTSGGVTAGGSDASNPQTYTTGTTSLSITGAPGLGTLDVGGTIGTDTNEGGAGIVIGSLVIRF